jgi:hypothetical protein
MIPEGFFMLSALTETTDNATITAIPTNDNRMLNADLDFIFFPSPFPRSSPGRCLSLERPA